MSFLAFSGLLNLASSVSLGVLVVSRNVRSRLHQDYFLLNLSVGIFSLGYLGNQLSTDPGAAMPWFHVLFAGVIFINMAYVRFVLSFLGMEREKKGVRRALTVLGVASLAALPAGGFFTELVPKFGWGHWPVVKPLFHGYLFFWHVACGFGFYQLLRAWRRAEGERRAQIRRVTIAVGVGYVGGATNWPVYYDIPFPPYANAAITLYVAMVALAMVRHGLMDVRLAVRQVALFFFVAMCAVAPVAGWISWRTGAAVSGYSLPPLLSASAFLSLSALAIFNNPRSPVNVAYAIFALATAWWQGSWSVLFNVQDPETARWIVRLGYTGIVFLPASYYGFTLSFLGRPKRIPLAICLAVSFAFVALLWSTDLFVSGFYRYAWGFYPKAGPLHPAYLVFLSVLAVDGIRQLLAAGRRAGVQSPLAGHRVRWVLIANFVYCLAAVDFLCNYGAAVYPLGFVPILTSLLLVGYASGRHHVLELTLAFRYVAIHGALMMVVGGPTAAVLWWLTGSGTAALGGLLMPAVGYVLVEMGKGMLSDLVDRLPLFKGRYDKLNGLPRLIAPLYSAAGVDDWCRRLVESARALSGAKRVALLYLDPRAGAFVVRASSGLPAAPSILMGLDPEGALAGLLRSGPVVASELDEDMGDARTPAAKEELRYLGAEVGLPIFQEGTCAAVLAIGPSAGARRAFIEPGEADLRVVRAALAFPVGGDMARLARLIQEAAGGEVGESLSDAQLLSAVNHVIGGTQLLDFPGADAHAAPGFRDRYNRAAFERILPDAVRDAASADPYGRVDVQALRMLAEQAELALRTVLANEKRERLLAEAAHDLLHPFGPKGCFHSLSEAADHVRLSSPGLARRLELADQDARFVRRRLEMLLRGEGAPLRRPAEIGPLFNRLEERFRPEAEERGIAWSVEPPAGAVRVLLDGDALEHEVLVNVLSNAFRHTPKGGKIVMRSEIRRGLAVVEVRDTGPGIPARLHDRIFDRGVQGAAGSERGYAGLGLYNARKAVSSVGGRIRLESASGKGAAFFVELPVEEETA